MSEKPKLVIVGGGFAGLNVAKMLGNKKVDIKLIDRTNHHLFQPLLYQVATAGLSPAEIAYPIRSILSSFSNVDVQLGEVTDVDLQQKKVITKTGKESYDYLVMACGANHAYFGNEDWEEFAPGLKNLQQATEIRRRILSAFEKAESCENPEESKEHMTFVIVGGGPTGVELAGALGEISRYTLKQDFRKIDPNSTRIILVEAGQRILSGFNPDLSRKATRCLESLGVQVWVNSRVTDVTPEGVKLGGEFLKAKTVLWAAGVKASPLNERLGAPVDDWGRTVVEQDLSLPEHPEVFVLGDQSVTYNDKGEELPGVAPVAMQQGRHTAKNIQRLMAGKPSKPFRYFDKGLMATIGRRRAVLQSGGVRMHGFLAWAAWLVVHVFYLIGFKNRLLVLIQWAYHYISFARGARLIVDKNWRFYQSK